MNRPINVEALSGYRLRVAHPTVYEAFPLGRRCRRGVFTPLADEAFCTVRIGQFGQIAWSQDIDDLSGRVYTEITQTTARSEPAQAEVSRFHGIIVASTTAITSQRALSRHCTGATRR